jgi:hypothetical protein
VSLRPLHAAVAKWAPGAGIAGDPLLAIVTAWPGIVGDQVAAHCRPVEIAGSSLVVATRSSAWTQQLHFLSEAILPLVRALPAGAGVTRLAFRAGALREPARRHRTAPISAQKPAARGPGAVEAPAANAQEAVERLRRRFSGLERAAKAACERCGAPLGPSPAGTACAPCAGRQATARTVATERLLYLCPWLEPDAVREQIPGLAPGEVERTRRRLLQRWWIVLERARRAQRLSRSGAERSIASSYVLLQSRLPPDRITPAVVRNILGPELERLLWPSVRP